jgi:predicted HD superfamily hydrolase involved in NAD metabolism
VTTTLGAMEARLREEIASHVSPQRASHCEGVAALAEALCRRFGERPEAGRIAGLGHDIARELDAEELRLLASCDGRPCDDDELREPVLLHGRAGAVLLARMGISDPAVLEAVRDHITGRPGMGTLSCIVYVADYLEPGRCFLDEPARLSALRGSLAEMVRFTVRDVTAYLGSRGKRVTGVSRAVEEWAEQGAGGR